MSIFSCIRTSKIYSLSNIQIYNSLLNILTMLLFINLKVKKLKFPKVNIVLFLLLPCRCTPDKILYSCASKIHLRYVYFCVPNHHPSLSHHHFLPKLLRIFLSGFSASTLLSTLSCSHQNHHLEMEIGSCHSPARNCPMVFRIKPHSLLWLVRPCTIWPLRPSRTSPSFALPMITWSHSPHGPAGLLSVS